MGLGVSVGDIGEEFEDRGDGCENGVRIVTLRVRGDPPSTYEDKFTHEGLLKRFINTLPIPQAR